MSRLMIVAALCCLAVTSNVEAAKNNKKKPKVDQGPDLALLFAKLDVNKDNKVSVKEFDSFNGLQAAAGAKNVKKANKANKAAKFQISTTVAAKPVVKKPVVKKPANKAKKPKNGNKAKKPKKNQSNNLAQQRAAWFKALDTNKDGYLTLEEFTKIKEVIGGAAGAKKKNAA
ncbi:EF-hand domain-containing protein [Zavarzinella formosa]|uniref:EF-hand domain-containing protein n=1 Tax=Zavarzinella formosa TaxID=360055 RepID=UPI0002DA1C63|nr:EF-hand domain-containing protein [Zavarzinella formosa]